MTRNRWNRQQTVKERYLLANVIARSIYRPLQRWTGRLLGCQILCMSKLRHACWCPAEPFSRTHSNWHSKVAHIMTGEVRTLEECGNEQAADSWFQAAQRVGHPASWYLYDPDGVFKRTARVHGSFKTFSLLRYVSTSHIGLTRPPWQHIGGRAVRTTRCDNLLTGLTWQMMSMSLNRNVTHATRMDLMGGTCGSFIVFQLQNASKL